MEISEILLSESSFLYTVLHNVRFSGNNSRVCNLSFWYLSFIQIKDDHLILFFNHSYKPSPPLLQTIWAVDATVIIFMIKAQFA